VIEDCRVLRLITALSSLKSNNDLGYRGFSGAFLTPKRQAKVDA